MIGLSIADHLSLCGASITVIEPGPLDGSASGASLGGLTPWSDSYCSLATRKKSVISLRQYPKWIDRIVAMSGHQVRIRNEGLILGAMDDSSLNQLRNRYESNCKVGVETTYLQSVELQIFEPAICTQMLAALHYSLEHSLDPNELMAALRAVVVNASAIVADRVVSLEIRNRRIISAECDHSGRVKGDLFVVAAGIWSPKILGTQDLPIVPIRGQAVLLHSKECELSHHVYCNSTYVVPRSNGMFAVGVTYEDAGEQGIATAFGVMDILASATELIPSLSEARFVRAWAGLRPKSPDGAPIIGRSRCYENLLYAVGHHGLGITLAPWTGEHVAKLIGGKESEVVDFDPARFGL